MYYFWDLYWYFLCYFTFLIFLSYFCWILYFVCVCACVCACVCVCRYKRVWGRRRGLPVCELSLREHGRFVPLRLQERIRDVTQTQPLRCRVEQRTVKKQQHYTELNDVLFSVLVPEGSISLGFLLEILDYCRKYSQRFWYLPHFLKYKANVRL